jgi:hypothetical protein
MNPGDQRQEQYEAWHAFVAAHLSQPVLEEARDDGTYLTGGDPPEVVVCLRDGSITVFEFAIRWQGASTPLVKPRRVGTVVWRHLPERAAMRAVQSLIQGARDARLQKFLTCDRCGRREPPEWMDDRGICQACAQPGIGVVH